MYLKKLFITTVIVLANTFFVARAQNMSNTTISTCLTTIYDDGGPNGDYTENNYQMTICAASGTELYFVVQELILGTAFNGDSDILVIYEGTGTGGAVLFDSQVNSAPSAIIASNDPCITITIDTDPAFFSTDVAAGFSILVSCTVPETCNDGILNNGEVMIDCGGPNCTPCYQVSACAPNVVDNGDFETPTAVCGVAQNTGFGSTNQIPRPWFDQTPIDGWWGTAKRIDDNISYPSPDYFNNSCTNSSAIACMDGVGSVGFFVHFGGNQSAEYIQTQLNTPLVAGKEYCVSVRASTMRGFSVGGDDTDKLGFWFHNNTYANGTGFIEWNDDNGGSPFLGTGTIVNGSPQVVNPPGQMITPTCQDFTYSFCATGGEQYLVVGNFTPGPAASGSTEYVSIDNLVIVESCPPDFDATITASGVPDCAGSCVDLYLDVFNQTGGCEITNDFTFQWYENGVLMAGQTNDTLFSVCPTTNVTYSVEITYTAGCQTTVKPESATFITFNCTGGFNLNATANPATICAGDCTDLTATPDQPGTYTYSWTEQGNATVIGTTQTINVCPTVTTTYEVTADDGTNQATATVTVTVNSSPDPGTNGAISYCPTDAPTDLFNSLVGTPDAGGTWSPALTSGTGVFDPNVDPAGTYTYSLPACGGGFVTADVVVTINPEYNIVEDLDLCAGSNYTYPDGTVSNNILANETHISNLNTTFGCDSIITTNINIITAYNLSENFDVCTGADYTYPDGTTSTNITVNESHVSNLISSTGCDSNVTTNLNVITGYNTNESFNLCPGSNFTYPDGTTSTNITVNESHVSNLLSITGCDSVVTTDLTVDPVYNLSENITVCENSTITYPDGTNELITGNTSHTSNLNTVAGCDSVIVTNVTMTPIYNLTENVNACENSSVTFPDGTAQTITASLSHTSNLTSVAGCDSIIVTNVNMLTAYTLVESVSICAGEDYTYPDGTTHTNITVDETYTSSYVSVNGCDSTIVTNLTANPLPNVQAGSDLTVCEGDNVTLTATGAQSYVWDNNVQNGVPFTPSSPSVTFTVTGTDANGCVNTDQVTIQVSPAPVVSFMGDRLSGCAPLEVTFTNLTTPAGVNCVWTLGDGTVLTGCGSVTHTYMNQGTYDVGLTVTSADGCIGHTTYIEYIEVVSPPNAAIVADQYVVDIDDPEVQFYNNTSGGDSYEWHFGDGLSSFEFEPSHQFPGIGNSNYEVMMVASNAQGCVDTAYLNIIVNDVLVYFVPNAFTPDGDEWNETFQPVFTSGYDPYDYHLMIFNRWGEMIFESYNAAVGWNGHYGDGGLVEDGVYVWKIEFKETMSDKKHEAYGHVTVLK